MFGRGERAVKGWLAHLVESKVQQLRPLLLPVEPHAHRSREGGLTTRRTPVLDDQRFLVGL